MEMDREFQGIWIPKEMWFDKTLNWLEKIILLEINSLCTDEHGCYASNEYLADFCQCGITKVSLTIAKLIDKGYIYQESFNGKVRVLRIRLSKNERQIFTKCKAIDNITNNKYNTNENTNRDICVKHKYGEFKHVMLTDEEYEKLCKEYGTEATANAIKKVDEYVETSGRTYKNYYLVMKKWGYKEDYKKQDKKYFNPKNPQIITHEYTDEFLNSLYDNLDDIEV